MQILGGIFGALFGGGKGPQPLPQATRDDGAAAAAKDTALLRRKGALADMTNGSTGYELGAQSTGRLVVGN